MSYTDELEKQNQALQEKLAETQKELEDYKRKSAYDLLIEEFKKDHFYAYTFHCNIAVTLSDDRFGSRKKCNEMAAKIMKVIFKCENYEPTTGS